MEAAGDASADDLTQVVRGAVRDLTGRELTDADLALSLDELELDSLVLVDVICEIEDHLGAELDDRLLEQMVACASLEDMVALYRRDLDA